MPKGIYDRTKAKKRAPQRDDILAAAMRVYAHYGFEGATITRMAQEAGVSNALIHAYFGDKQSLVRAVVANAVAQNLQAFRKIDETPGLSLRERERHIYTIYKENRDAWRLIYDTLLVPSFQFELRSIIEGYIDQEYENMLRYLKEFRNASAETVRAFTYAMLSLRQQYILDGRETDFFNTREQLFDLFLNAA